PGRGRGGRPAARRGPRRKRCVGSRSFSFLGMEELGGIEGGDVAVRGGPAPRRLLLQVAELVPEPGELRAPAVVAGVELGDRAVQALDELAEDREVLGRGGSRTRLAAGDGRRGNWPLFDGRR